MEYVFKVLREHNSQLKSINSFKVPFKNEIEIEQFSDIQHFRAYYYGIYINMKEMKSWNARKIVKKETNKLC